MNRKRRHVSLSPGPAPTLTQYEHHVAQDLSLSLWGLSREKCKRVPYLPLFVVAIEGMAGMDRALEIERHRALKAA